LDQGILVEVSSAQRSARDHFYKVEDANHIEVCKPLSKQDFSYSQLVQLIKLCQQVETKVHDLPRAIFGMERYVERVEAMVTSKESDADPHYVGVWGMGGVGKTLLLQKVDGSSNVCGHFQGAKFIWLTVGHSPDIMALYRTLSAELDLKPVITEFPEVYKDKLADHFLQRRVFLVLDDVWKVEAFNSLDLARGKGSVTMLSTRDQLILDRIPSENFSQLEMRPLLKESWSLFCEHAFKRLSNVPRDLEAVAQRVAEECQGLPLDQVIGGAMCGKVNRKYEWEPLLKVCMARKLDKSVEEQLYERLELGYNLLSEDDCRLKECFHYFAAFPEDSTIVFEEILFHWTAEKLVPVDDGDDPDGDDPAADAFCLLKKLWERSFIESNGEFNSDKCYMLTFKVHDVMRDLAFYILRKDCGTPPTPPAKQLYFYRAGRNWRVIPEDWRALSVARRISLDTNKLDRLPESLCARNLVSLLLGRNPIISLPANFSSNFPMLSVLNLRNGQFHSLPEELGDLQNLVCLDLSNCHDLDSLPNSVRKLHELKFLILDDCWSLKCLPSGIGDLTSLQVLHTAQCSSLIWAENISSWTAIAGSSYLHPTVGASLENVCRLLLLTELTISTKQMFEIPDVFKQFRDEITHNTYSPTTLQLIQQALLPSELPHNICSLTELKLLQISMDIKTLPAEMADHCLQLQELELRSSILEYLPRSFTCCGAFPALIRLQLSSSRLLQFPEVDEGAMCNLRILNLSNCQRLQILPLSLQLLTSLRSLVVVGCNRELKKCCRRNCESSAIWREFHILYNRSVLPAQNDNERRYTFHSRYNNELTLMNVQWRM
jgi:Leucine-rich repeat (LRR) protein